MAKPKLKILMVAAEVAPFSSVGGLSQVLYFLSRALIKLGHDVRIFTPKYGIIEEKEYKLEKELDGMLVPTGEAESVKELVCNVKSYKHGARDPRVYFLENMEYFEKRGNVYGYNDDHVRFALLSRGALEYLRQRKEKWIPDVIHIHDWHTSYLVNDLRTRYAALPEFSRVSTILSIHNLYQGNIDYNNASDLNFDDGKGPLAGFFSERFFKQNSLKRGIIYADAVSTVSETHSREIMTEEFGVGLHNLLKEVRTKLFGILNGLDNQEFDPKTDTLIKRNFSLAKIENRLENKIELQKEFNLKVKLSAPIFSMIGRLDVQKGIDLVVEVLPFLLEENEQLQFIAMGGGDPRFKDFFKKLEKQFPRRVGTHLLPNFTLPRKIFSGTDVLMLPSLWEPGGIVAIEGMRYGAVPLVRATGGLADSVSEFDLVTGQGTGFRFEKYNGLAFMGALTRALMVIRSKKDWNKLVKNCMKQDFSWDKVATKYEDVYTRSIDFRKQQIKKSPHQAYRVEY